MSLTRDATYCEVAEASRLVVRAQDARLTYRQFHVDVERRRLATGTGLEPGDRNSLWALFLGAVTDLDKRRASHI